MVYALRIIELSAPLTRRPLGGKRYKCLSDRHLRGYSRMKGCYVPVGASPLPETASEVYVFDYSVADLPPSTPPKAGATTFSGQASSQIHRRQRLRRSHAARPPMGREDRRLRLGFTGGLRLVHSAETECRLPVAPAASTARVSCIATDTPCLESGLSGNLPALSSRTPARRYLLPTVLDFHRPFRYQTRQRLQAGHSAGRQVVHSQVSAYSEWRSPRSAVRQERSKVI